MDELLQKHGCSNVFTIPDGLRELMADISREVLREQPVSICDFITNYLSALLITREHGIMAVKILDDLCDCRPSVSEHLIKEGMTENEAKLLSQIIKEEIESVGVVEGKEKVKETEILKKILKRNPLDEEMTAKVCQITRNAYRDYCYRKKLLTQNIKVHHGEPWEIAAQHTLEIYKRTKPSFSDLTRATQKIQAAYRGYYVRRKMLRHLKPKKKHAPKVDLQGPPVDIAESREIDLGPVVDIKEKVRVDNISARFTDSDNKAVGVSYNTMKTIKLTEPSEQIEEIQAVKSTTQSRMMPKTTQSEVIGAAESKKSDVFGDKETKKSGLFRDTESKQSDVYGATESKKSNMFSPKESKKSGLGFADSVAMTSWSAEDVRQNSNTDELPAAIEEEIPKINFAPSKNITIEDNIAEDLLGGGESSEAPTPTYELELTSATSKTASVPTSASTTAPTSDIEDIATSGTEGEEHE